MRSSSAPAERRACWDPYLNNDGQSSNSGRDAVAPRFLSRQRENVSNHAVTDWLNQTFKHWSLLPAVILFLTLSIYPTLNLLWMSTSTITFQGGEGIWAFAPEKNWALLRSDPVLRDAFVNTFIFVVVAVAAEMVIGLAIALLVANLRRGKGLVRTVMILPILVPPVAIGSMWRLIYNFEFGVLNQALGVFGIEAVNWLGSPSLALVSVILVDVWHWVPFVFLILFAAVEGVPVDVIEAARVDGAKEREIALHIVLPLLKPAILVALIFRSILAFKAFDEVFLLTSGGPGTATELISLHLYKVFFEQNHLGYGAMLSVVVILMIVAFLVVGRRATNRG